LLGREKQLHVYGPKGIKEAITLLLKLGDSWTNYPLVFHELTSTKPQIILEDDKVIVQTIPLRHRVYTNGFLFKEKPAQRKLNVAAVAKYKIDKAFFQNIKNGKDITLEDGRVIDNQLLSFDPPQPKTYAYCSDTAFEPGIIDQIKDADTLYHESTFLDVDRDLSVKTQHATAKEAATIAKAASVGLLILGHYSTRYKSIELFREEALEVFDKVTLADDGKIFEF
jgi:ribonuclease Z